MLRGSLSKFADDVVKLRNLPLAASNLVGHLLDSLLQLLYLLLCFLGVRGDAVEKGFQRTFGSVKHSGVVLRHIVENRADILRELLGFVDGTFELFQFLLHPLKFL